MSEHGYVWLGTGLGCPWVGTGGHRAQEGMGRYGWGQVTMGRYGWAQGSEEGRPGPIWSVQCCWPVLSCAAPMLDTFEFLLDSSSQTTVLSSRRHDVGQDQSLGCSSQEGIAASVLQENRAFKPPWIP